MILPASKSSRQLAPLLRRVLLIEQSQASGRMMAELIKDLGAGRIYTETTEPQALQTCELIEPQLIITELAGRDFDGHRFTRSLRRSTLACRAAPVIMVTAEATAAAILGARNAGVHEFLRKPFTLRDLSRRIEAVMLTSRDWIEAVNYIGPDRRRFNSGDYRGPRKRHSDNTAQEEAGRIDRALRILQAALDAIEGDPAQARRALQAQAADLLAVAGRTNDAKLLAAAAPLQRAVMAFGEAGALCRPALEAACAPLWAFTPAETPGALRQAM